MSLEGQCLLRIPPTRYARLRTHRASESESRPVARSRDEGVDVVRTHEITRLTPGLTISRNQARQSRSGANRTQPLPRECAAPLLRMTSEGPRDQSARATRHVVDVSHRYIFECRFQPLDVSRLQRLGFSRIHVPGNRKATCGTASRHLGCLNEFDDAFAPQQPGRQSTVKQESFFALLKAGEIDTGPLISRMLRRRRFSLGSEMPGRLGSAR